MASIVKLYIVNLTVGSLSLTYNVSVQCKNILIMVKDVSNMDGSTPIHKSGDKSSVKKLQTYLSTLHYI